MFTWSAGLAFITKSIQDIQIEDKVCTYRFSGENLVLSNVVYNLFFLKTIMKPAQSILS